MVIGDLLILSLYAFPMSFAEEWAFGDPKKGKKNAQTHFEYWPHWLQKVPRAAAGLVAGSCLMIGVVVLGAAAFALYYQLSDRPDMLGQILPRFAYWFPFALLGMVTDIPFQIIYWEDNRLRVLLRLVIWWFPRSIIVAFVVNPPLLQDLDPATTALVVLAVDVVLAAFCLGLYTTREQMWGEIDLSEETGAEVIGNKRVDPNEASGDV